MSVKSYNYPKDVIIRKKYPNGNLAVFIENCDGEPLAELSVNTESVDLNPNEFILKDYSENSPITHILLESEKIIPTDRFILIGSNLCPICKIAI